MISRLGFALSLLTLAVFGVMAAGPGTERFDPKAYPSGPFRVSHREYPQGDISVRVIQVKRVDNASGKAPSYCRAWLEIWKASRLLRQFYFDDIEPVGGGYGIFVPERQPFPNNFIAVKEGDYDGRLLLISKDGSAVDLPGGPYFATPDRRYLIGLHSRDSNSLVIIDVAKRKVVLDGDKEGVPEIHSWYMDDRGYFFTEVDQTDNEKELKGAVYRLDLKHLRIVKVKMRSANLAAARRIDYDFDARGMTNCASAHD